MGKSGGSETSNQATALQRASHADPTSHFPRRMNDVYDVRDPIIPGSLPPAVDGRAVVRKEEAESSTTCHNMMDQNHFGMACKVAVAAMLC